MTHPPIHMIVAMDRNRVIGRAGKLPWRIPADLRRFRALTMHHSVIMGRKTWLSVGNLPFRHSIVLTRDAELPLVALDEADFAPSMERSVEIVQERTGDKPVWIIGGAEVYRQFMPIASRIELTLVDGQHTGDTYFPADILNDPHWHEVAREHATDCQFITFERVQI